MYSVLCLLVVALYAQPTPFTVAPNLAVTIPLNNGDPVFVDACRGIGQAIALQEAAQGSHVVCTTRNTHSFKEGAAIAGKNISLWELDYTQPGNALLIGVTFEVRFGRRPARAYFAAETTMNGLWQSYNRSLTHYTIDMSIAGPFELQNYWTRNDATAPHMVITSISSFDAWVPLIGLMDGYNLIERTRLDTTRSMGTQLLYANTEYLITFCIFTNTTTMATSINPTAQVRSGNLFAPQNDCVAQQFQAIALELGLLYGLPTSFVGLGAVQVASMRAAFGNDTIFDVSGPYSAAFGSVQQYALFSLPGAVFNEVYYEVVLGGFGIDLRRHAQPCVIGRKRDVKDLKLFRAADDVMARPKYAAHLARYQAAKTSVSH